VAKKNNDGDSGGAKAEKQSKPQKVTSDFPKHTLEDAIRIVVAIEDANAGNPYPPTDTAIALGVSPGSSTWRSLTAAANKYGLISGTYKTDRLSLTPIGTRVASPTSPEDRQTALVSAGFSPPKFAAIFEYFKGKKLPEAKFMENTLAREFEIPKQQAAQCAEIFIANATLLGLAREAPTGTWLGSEPAGSTLADVIDADEDEAGSDEGVEQPFDGGQVENLDASQPEIQAPKPVRKKRGQAVFVGHGKSKKPLEQLVKILNEYGIPHKVAVDEANEGRPISTKVAQVMDECGAAILIFTADEEFRTVDGAEVWRPSENVVYELGAASILYDQRIIIFKEEGVTFPSNFKDIGYIEFQKNALESKGIDLFRELIAFKIIEVSVPTG
jgi:predicted nucleotide-binding protein